MGGPFTCSPGRAGALWSDAEVCLGDAASALVDATKAVADFEATDESRRNIGSERMTRCQQVKAHLALNQFQESTHALEPVLTTPAEHRVGPLVRRINEIERLAGSGARESRAALELLDATAEFKNTSVGMQPLD